ncbi:MAG: trypsin-like serine protease [Phycisphaerae bacterium]|nr:trypsin-like serine protease [Phycisphaerae bacterium]
MAHNRSVLFLAAALAHCCLLVVPPARGIVVSDEPNNHVVTPPSDFDMVGLLMWQGDPGSSAVLIDSWHILTAKHALSPGVLDDHRFELHLSSGTEVYEITARFLHPTADIAVGRLDRSTGLPGYGLYTQSNEVGNEGVLAGYGVSGTGLTGEDSTTYPRGTKRSGYNHIGQVYPQGDVDYLLTDFDRSYGVGPIPPGTLGASREVMIASGDSGGPMFIESGGDLLIAGVNISVSDQNGSHVLADFGDIGWHLRVSPLAAWITSQISDYKALSLTVVNGVLGHVEMEPSPTNPNQPEFPVGVSVTLTAVPSDGEQFSQWLLYDPNHPGDSNHAVADTNESLTLVMDADREVQAAFKCGSGIGPLLSVALMALSMWRFAPRRRAYRNR